MEDHRLMVFEKNILRRIFVDERESNSIMTNGSTALYWALASTSLS
jgi:hypothetical protein